MCRNPWYEFVSSRIVPRSERWPTISCYAHHTWPITLAIVYTPTFQKQSWLELNGKRALLSATSRHTIQGTMFSCDSWKATSFFQDYRVVRVFASRCGTIVSLIVGLCSRFHKLSWQITHSFFSLHFDNKYTTQHPTLPLWTGLSTNHTFPCQTTKKRHQTSTMASRTASTNTQFTQGFNSTPPPPPNQPPYPTQRRVIYAREW